MITSTLQDWPVVLTTIKKMPLKTLLQTRNLINLTLALDFALEIIYLGSQQEKPAV